MALIPAFALRVESARPAFGGLSSLRISGASQVAALHL